MGIVAPLGTPFPGPILCSDMFLSTDTVTDCIIVFAQVTYTRLQKEWAQTTEGEAR